MDLASIVEVQLVGKKARLFEFLDIYYSVVKVDTEIVSTCLNPSF